VLSLLHRVSTNVRHIRSKYQSQSRALHLFSGQSGKVFKTIVVVSCLRYTCCFLIHITRHIYVQIRYFRRQMSYGLIMFFMCQHLPWCLRLPKNPPLLKCVNCFFREAHLTFAILSKALDDTPINSSIRQTGHVLSDITV
jgi:hypothetical protein